MQSKPSIPLVKIRLEATSSCQLKCPACPTASKAILPTIKKGFLRLGDFQKLLEQNPSIKTVELSNYGEMFLNPELLGIIKYAYHKQVLLTANNGVNLNHVKQEILEALVKYEFKSLSCSIDGANQSSYAQYRIGGDFNTVISNIESINRLKKKYHTVHPELTWQFIIFKHNQHELSQARELANKLNIHFQTKLDWDNKLSPAGPDIVKNEFGVSSRSEYKKLHGNDYMQEICHQLWDNPQINWDGKVLGCCRNFWGDFGANVFTDGLVKALHNEKITYARSMLLGHHESRNDIPCTSCDIYLSMKENSKWLERTE